MSGEDSQNAMIAESGAPTASRAAMKGMTSQEQKGARPPNSAASTIMRVSRPSKARATSAAAPVALRPAMSRTAAAMKGNVPASAPAAMLRISPSLAESRAATTNGMTTINAQTDTTLRMPTRSPLKPRSTSSVIAVRC